MCLTTKFFDTREVRMKEWKKNGLSIDEACSSLRLFYSTIYPVATEVAEFIYENWTLQDVDRLPVDAKNILNEIVQPVSISTNDYLEVVVSRDNLSRPFTLVENMPFTELLEKATYNGNEKEIYQKCLSIIYLKDPKIFEAVANEITNVSTDRIFLGYSEQDILGGKNSPADHASRDPIKLFIGRPRYTYAKMNNEAKLNNIEKFFNRAFADEGVLFVDTAFSKSVAHKFESMTKNQAEQLLEGLL